MIFQVYTKDQILKDVDDAIKNKRAFSLIRFGDGGLKAMQSLLNNHEDNIEIISNKEGIPVEEFNRIISLWAIYANSADYIDTPTVYFNNRFWKRYKKDHIPINILTENLLKKWNIIYESIKIKTKEKKYCNPEFNWLSILNYPVNLLDILKNRKICFISIYDDIPRLSSKFDVDFHKIVGHYENQFKYSFKETIEFIEENIDNYDLWLNSSGELGRLYSGRIKELGGVVIDMGFVAQYWYNFKRPERFNRYIEPDIQNPLLMKLTRMGKRYKDFI